MHGARAESLRWRELRPGGKLNRFSEARSKDHARNARSRDGRPFVTNDCSFEDTVMNKQTNQTGHSRHARPLGRCKVCTKQIRSEEDHAKVFFGGNYYLVCCASCAAKFEAHPQQYLVS